MIITTSDLETKLKGQSTGAFLFFGEEEYLKRHYLSRFRSALVSDADFSVFNHVIINGGDLNALESELQSLPMLDMLGGGQRLIELRDTNFDKISKSDLEALCTILSDVGDNTVIIYTLPSELSEGTKKKPSAALKALSDVCCAVSFERQTPAKLVGWLTRHFTARGCLCDPDTCRFIIEYCTPDMFILSSETEKLTAYALSHGLNRVDIPMVRTVCSQSKVIGAFDFSNALIDADISLAMRVLSDMIKHRARPEEIMSTIITTYSELLTYKMLTETGMNKADIAKRTGKNEYYVQVKLRALSKYSLSYLEKMVELCSEADRQIKSMPINKYYIIEELILKSCSINSV